MNKHCNGGTSVKRLSIVIPVFNEVESLPHLHKSIQDALASLSISWEVVYVDDGSTDGSVQVMERLAEDDPEHVCVVVFRRNYGQTAALAAGIEHARGEVIVLMDADLQNDPADIPMMLEKLDEGYDVVCGWRANRRDKLVTRRIPSQIANRLISKVTSVRLHDYGCTLKAFRREVLKSFRLYGEMHRFIPAYAAHATDKVLEVPVRHHARRFGKSKYGLGRTLKVVLDLCTVNMLTHFAAKPMYIFGRIGLTVMAASLLPLLYAAIQNLALGKHEPVAPMFIGAAVLFVLGVQCIFAGMLAEVLTRTYHESQGKTPYVIKRLIVRKDRDNGFEATEELNQLRTPADR